MAASVGVRGSSAIARPGWRPSRIPNSIGAFGRAGSKSAGNDADRTSTGSTSGRPDHVGIRVDRAHGGGASCATGHLVVRTPSVASPPHEVGAKVQARGGGPPARNLL